MTSRARPVRFPIRYAAFVGALLVIGVAFSLVDLSPDLDHMHLRMLSGPVEGNYATVVDRLGAAAARRHGTLANQHTSGTVDNLERLAAAAEDCGLHFALVQDGVPPPAGSDLELIGRMPRSETVFLIGRGASRYRLFADLANARIGIGPANSGTAHLARRVLESPQLSSLGLRLSNHALAEQIAQLERGELDLGVFVVDENAVLIHTLVRDRGLELAALEHLAVLSSQYTDLSAGVIRAGHYDPVAVRPPEDRPVLRVDTLVIGNGCAGRSEELGLLSLFAAEFPHFITHNRGGGPSAYLPPSTTAMEFYDTGGPTFSDRYLPPWVLDIMPPGNWFYVVAALSVVLNLLTGWHRFRLWRIDARRDKAADLVRDLLGDEPTPDEIRSKSVRELVGDTADPHTVAGTIDRVVAELSALRLRCRRQENSVLVPMGQEWIYRYEEEQMEQLLTALREFRSRLGVG